MNTLTIILSMVAVAVLLLLGAVGADYLLQRRMQKRLAAEEAGEAAKKRDTADSVIELLNRASEAVTRSLQSAKQDENESDTA